MGYNRAAPRRQVNMTLNEDLIRRAQGITPDLSETVKKLLATFVEDEEARKAAQDRDIAAHVAANEAFVAKHGSLADEFNGL